MSLDWLSRGRTLERKQGLPEAKQYVDRGCEVAPACLSCPLEECIYVLADGGVPLQKVHSRKVKRDKEIRFLAGHGVSRRRISREYGISLRSVYRVLAAPARV